MNRVRYAHLASLVLAPARLGRQKPHRFREVVGLLASAVDNVPPTAAYNVRPLLGARLSSIRLSVSGSQVPFSTLDCIDGIKDWYGTQGS